MSESPSFWTVDCAQGEPDLFVCMACLEEVFQGKVPINGCPGCGAVSTFEPFSLDAIRDWGTDNLIAKSVECQQTPHLHRPDSQ
ncbi:MAG: hypothetical protein KC563_02555 [Nitrospira sp.]|nr:hypothetical protein [Nitrospira sp.]MCB9710159.1 hypothetical protein [Nitrospiraceae bacterium]MDR4486703.1 hypothetical protein [Nitrospirales bacterium]MCA9464147.1 hypothetical protein [Nitrospira sp.]MCA9474677.1 hypothetical protein [Nitrospira sp.]